MRVIPDLASPAEGIGQALVSVGRRRAAPVARYAGLCRGVEIATDTTADLAGDTDSAYGFRVFLRHYCVHLAGRDPSAALPAFPADARAARGLNGDIARHCRQWRRALESGTVSADLLEIGVARKTLLAVAGLVSVHDRTWTTDCSRAARRWGKSSPASPPRWARCRRGPRPNIGTRMTKPRACSSTTASSPRLSSASADDWQDQQAK